MRIALDVVDAPDALDPMRLARYSEAELQTLTLSQARVVRARADVDVALDNVLAVASDEALEAALAEWVASVRDLAGVVCDHALGVPA